MMRPRVAAPRLLLGFVLLFGSFAHAQTSPSYDVIVYGASSAGVIAAVQAARTGKSTLLISQNAHVGGMTASGLGTTDTGNAATIGGLALAFYRSIYAYYAIAAYATMGSPADERPMALTGDSPGFGVKFDFEPHVAEAIFRGMLDAAGASTVFGEQLDRRTGVARSGTRIVSVRMKSGRVYSARMFIDATYEGDLLAAANIPYRIGRESRNEYNESLAGVYHDEFLTGEVDPYRTPGDPTSGLLPGIAPASPGPNGAGDHRAQQFNLRLCLTNVLANRVPFTRPATYQRADYELLRRRILQNPGIPITDVIKIHPLPCGKVDINANGSFSTDMAGDEPTRWAEASDEERAAIMQRYRDYTAGLFWFLTDDPAVPVRMRVQAAQWGRAADEFRDTDHWPWQLYVRESRRMMGAYTMTQHHCDGEVVAPDSVALGSYSIDSHKVTLFVDSEGRLHTEGYFSHGVPPYPISYRALIPDAADCGNLLAPICVSATRVAFNSMRMEPVYMMLGQAAATAACLAIDGRTTVQRVNYATLARQLRADGQILDWHNTGSTAADMVDEPDTEDTSPNRVPGFRGVLR